MSGRTGSDLLTLPIGEGLVKEEEYLSDLSPKDKPWDRHRGEADDVREVYGSSSIQRHQRYGMRVEQCSQVIAFARDPPTDKKKSKLKLKAAWFCRVRHCPVCQWRRSLCWQAKVYQALPRLVKDYPRVRFLFMTLTIRNCPVEELRKTLDVLRCGWERFTKLRKWPAIGWVRAVEITRSKDGSAHPHYHCLLMVHPGYFGDGYIKQREWSELWQRCLGVNYRPIVDIRVVVPDHKPDRRKTPGPCDIWGAVVEILKYSVKPSDMVKDHQWFLTLVDQVWKTKAVVIGGVFRRYIKEREREDLTAEPGKEPVKEDLQSLYFGWKQPVRRYRKLNLDKGMVLVNGQRRV
jgi:plasmid rolling circle replication initiator protein Rep